MTDVIVVGGGIMGLMTARELARTGRKVLLLDKAQPGTGATWASAGIISPHGSSGAADLAGEAGVRLRLPSYDMWLNLPDALIEESGMDPEFRLTGVLLLAINDEEKRAVLDKAKTRQWGDTEWIEPKILSGEEPTLTNKLEGALLVKGGNVDVRRLGASLEIACRRAGVEIRAGVLTQEIVCDENRVLGVNTSEGKIEAPVVVICAGVGSPGILGARPTPPITPQRGQVVALDARELGIRRVLMNVSDPYFVPRSDGKLIIGATREFAGEDHRLTAGGISRLLGSAIDMIPALDKAPILETWTGFRPLSSDHLPLIGESHILGLFFCTGHGPTGITPAPLSAALVTTAITGAESLIDTAPYDPKRFD
ncbi:MAG: FAD-dependent oxidoreductase [Nitrospinaceae bacterium]|jgi:glycine oxidase|nr:FAD-dependent oxidoreductase [Nitrospinaceae bacterium]MBT3434384.1 FAD-dependent oxidoreductase [Nitrospinaceae bacterium]MBT4093659.1 FAD-dependent oxidoreductase [Nitrospinaceae bacterium]MBT4429364.1 FAD-dependent oxidoreductase [Nitrospinaceae bacterium]MBT5366452.1 FAD-dependent oxidoreductase [Nitrospinaceae bacterium]